tara:strand:- start:323 stop:670 length:348 start_codon:yes stop_codon:yes gene_type:complete
MNTFLKENFEYSGGFLMYKGPYDGQKTYGEAHANECLSATMKDIPKPLFIARFKHSGPITKAVFQKELIGSYMTVERYADEIADRKTPVDILRTNNPNWYEVVMTKWKLKHNISY